MKFVTYFKDTLKVNKIMDYEVKVFPDIIGVARCENIITAPQFGHLIVKNLETKTEEYTEIEVKEVEKLNELTNKVELVAEEVEVVKTREYQICELEAVENPNKEKIIQLQEIKKQIQEKKVLLEKYKYDIQQVDLFGMERTDYEQKKSLCVQLVLELRELENSLKA